MMMQSASPARARPCHGPGAAAAGAAAANGVASYAFAANSSIAAAAAPHTPATAPRPYAYSTPAPHAFTPQSAFAGRHASPSVGAASPASARGTASSGATSAAAGSAALTGASSAVAAALHLKRQLDGQGDAPRSHRRVWIKDVLNAPLWHTHGSNASIITTAASSAVSNAVGAATISTPSAGGVSPSSGTFTAASLCFGAPAVEMACARVMGSIVSLLCDELTAAEPTAAHFLLEDSSGEIRITIPLELLFAALPTHIKRQVRGKKAGAGHSSDTCCSTLLSTPIAVGWLPAVSSVVDVCGGIELCGGSTRRLLVSSFDLVRARRLPAADGCPARELSVSDQLQDRARELTQLYKQHFFRALHMPPPPLQQSHTPNRMTTPSAAPGGVRTPPSAGGKSPATSPFSSHVASSSAHKRNGFAAAAAVGQTPKPAIGKLTFPVSPAHPLPLPLPLPLPATGSYFDELGSSQEDQAHVALADQATHNYMQQKQQQEMLQRQSPPLPPPQSALPRQPLQSVNQPSPQQLQLQQHQRNVMYMQPVGMRNGAPVSAAAPPFNRASPLPSAVPAAFVRSTMPVTPATSRPSVIRGTFSSRPPSPATSSTAAGAAAGSSPAAFVPPRPRSTTTAEAAALAARIAAMEAAADAPPPSDPAVGFATGLGNVLAPSAAALKKAQLMQAQWNKEMATELRQLATPSPPPAAGAAMGAGAAARSTPSPSAAALAASTASRTLTPPSPPPPPFVELPSGADLGAFVPSFTSGSGKALVVSEAAKARAAKMMQEMENEEMAHEQQDQFRTPIKASAASAGAFHSTFSAGGFSSGPKPFRPPGVIRPPPTRAAAPCAASTPSRAGAGAAAPSDATSASAADAAAALRKAKMDLLDKQLEALEQGTGALDEQAGLESASAVGPGFSNAASATFITPSVTVSAASADASSSSPPPSAGSSLGPPPGVDLASFVPSFQTGRGKHLAISDAAKRKAEQMFSEMEREETQQQQQREGQQQWQTPVKKSSALTGVAPASSAHGGGFSSAKPFRPPASVRPLPSRAAAATNLTMTAGRGPFAPASSSRSSATASAASMAAAEARKARLAALDSLIDEADGSTDAMDDTAGAAAGGSFMTGANVAAGSATTPPTSFAAAGFHAAGSRATGFQSGRGRDMPVAESVAERARRVQMELMQDLGMDGGDECIDFGTAATADTGADRQQDSASVSFAPAGASFATAGFSRPTVTSDANDAADKPVDDEQSFVGLSSPVGGRKRKSLSQIPEESLEGTQTLSSQPASQPCSQSASQFSCTPSQPIIISARTLPPLHPTTHSTPVPVMQAQQASSDWWPALPLNNYTSAMNAEGSTTSSATSGSDAAATSTVSSSFDSPMPALVTPSPGLASLPSSLQSGVMSSPTATVQLHKRTRLNEDLTPSPATSVPTSTPTVVSAPTPIPIGSFSTPTSARVAARSQGSGGKDAQEVSPNSGSQLFIPATPSLDSQPVHSLEMQFDEVADEDQTDKQRDDSLDVQLQSAHSTTLQAPHPYLPPSLAAVSPAAGSPAALRYRASLRVSTFGAPAPPPSCSRDHVLHCLEADSKGSGRSATQTQSVSRAQLWQRLLLLLAAEFADGEDESMWSAEKRDTFVKLQQQWKNEMEQVAARSTKTTKMCA